MGGGIAVHFSYICARPSVKVLKVNKVHFQKKFRPKKCKSEQSEQNSAFLGGGKMIHV